MLIALLNASKYLADKIPQVQLIAQALSFQLRYHAAPAWSSLPWACSYFADPKLVPSSAYRLWLLDDSDAAGALGYHDQDPYGAPYGKVFSTPILDSSGDIMHSANSISVTASHEALEIFGDPQANYWAEMPDGRLIALELGDPVEGDAYIVKVGSAGVAVSNFVFPEYFDAAPQGRRFDKLRKLSAPFTMTAGGYQIIKAGGKVTNVFGANHPSWKLASKQHPAARTSKRGRAPTP